MDPEAVMNRWQHRLRRRTYVSRGPNYMWHVDGYDKLTPYGISINGLGINIIVCIYEMCYAPQIAAVYLMSDIQRNILSF